MTEFVNTQFSSTTYEEFSPQVRSVTITARKNVYYAVEVLQHNEWVTEWSRTVPFGQDKTHRPAGPAFRWAAAAQNAMAKSWVDALQPVGEA